jgi:hypothetical protein
LCYLIPYISILTTISNSTFYDDVLNDYQNVYLEESYGILALESYDVYAFEEDYNILEEDYNVHALENHIYNKA